MLEGCGRGAVSIRRYDGDGRHAKKLIRACGQFNYASGVPLAFEIHSEQRLLFIRGHGIVTQGERLRAMLAWLNDPDYECCEDALFDVTAAKTTPRVAELRQLIAILEQMPRAGPRRLAIVTSKPIAFGVAHVFGKLLRVNAIPLQVKVFMDAQSAWRWLRPDLLSSV